MYIIIVVIIIMATIFLLRFRFYVAKLCIICRVVSSEISDGRNSGNFRKFILIFPEISGNLLITYVSPSPTLQSDAVK